MNAQVIGWTLIHSLWQGLAIYLLLRIALKLVQSSNIKYVMGIGAMALMVTASVVTMFILSSKPATEDLSFVFNSSPQEESFIDQNIIWLIRFWAIGFSIGLLRIASGLWYIGRLRRSSHPVQQEWMDMVNSISESLNINRVVMMAEANVSSPMVVGFMKPIILFPIGLLSGLSAEQVETILVHELAHIRRQDYIINLVQSVIETIFFFNPSALLMSAIVREERENCCDDMVIERGVSPIIYVKTLAQLEAVKSSGSLAMAFTGNQNQLLNRIKRIMENSAKNDWGKSRLVPVALLFLGLVCASWLSISSEKEIAATQTVHDVFVNDTIKDNMIVIKVGPDHDDWVVFGPVEAAPPIFDMMEHPVMEMPIVFDLPPVPDMSEMPAVLAFDFQMQNQQLAIMQEQLEQQNLILEEMRYNTDAYKDALIKMLAEDGYFGNSDDFNNISINDNNGKLIINGREIKEKDAVKYRALQDTFFGNPKRHDDRVHQE